MAALLFLLLAASKNQMEQPLEAYAIQLNDEHEYSLIQKKDIEAWLLKNESFSLQGRPIGRLDLESMERLAETNPWIEKAEIFVDNRKVLQINLLQRSPVARVFTAEGQPFYLDSNLKEMPVNRGFYYPAPVFTNFPDRLPEAQRKRYLAEIAYIGKTVEADTFWNAQVAQIGLLPDHSYVIVPLLGKHKIWMGDTSRLREKLHNVLVFYQQVANKTGWDLYELLDARFAGQVVASPSVMPPVAVASRSGAASHSVNEGRGPASEVPAAQRPPPRHRQVRDPERSAPASARPGAARAAPAKEEPSNQPKYIYTGQ